MRKLRKLTVTVAALAALAVGGAAFAQAQNATTPIQAPAQQTVGDQPTPGDTPDAVAESDGPEGPNDPADSADRESQD